MRRFVLDTLAVSKWILEANGSHFDSIILYTRHGHYFFLRVLTYLYLLSILK